MPVGSVRVHAPPFEASGHGHGVADIPAIRPVIPEATAIEQALFGSTKRTDHVEVRVHVSGLSSLGINTPKSIIFIPPYPASMFPPNHGCVVPHFGHGFTAFSGVPVT